jgi:ankyrin repeat protein
MGRDDASPIHEAVIMDSFSDLAALLHRDPKLVDAVDGFVSCILLSSGYPTNTTPQGYTPLHLAADRGHTALAQYLVDFGANKNARVRQPPIDPIRTRR